MVQGWSQERMGDPTQKVTKVERDGGVGQVENACLAGTRLCVQTLVPQKKKKKEKSFNKDIQVAHKHTRRST
jgi:hypothetical protein